ncbi:hypothetical protein [Commensalibacter sp. Nvir]|uniref:hypothetical protein n=1 Tax=Commensalibacter sp. Nvir TaxID=3069817 RepID=UPI0030C883BD
MLIPKNNKIMGNHADKIVGHRTKTWASFTVVSKRVSLIVGVAPSLDEQCPGIVRHDAVSYSDSGPLEGFETVFVE